MDEIAIQINQISKTYRIGDFGYFGDSFKEQVYRWVGDKLKGAEKVNPKTQEIRHALQDVSLTVRKGESVGLIGKNGAGKSTLLKILSRVTTPTSGTAKIYGHVGALLEVGTGFNAILTGRENVYMGGTLLGMSRHEINSKMNQIIEFSGVGEYIDTPVKRYSSGMKLRLGFSVAAHLNADIMLIDEVLAVGDAEFRQRCMSKLNEVTENQGRTIIFVSHNLSMLQRLCGRAVLLEDGKLTLDGESDRVIQHYLSQHTKDSHEYIWTEGEKRATNGALVPIRLTIYDHDQRPTQFVDAKKGFYLEFAYHLHEAVRNLNVGFTISTGEGELFCTSWEQNASNRPSINDVAPMGVHVKRCFIPANLFSNGTFIVGVISGIPGSEKLYRNFEILKVHIDANMGVANLGRSILLPAFEWTQSARLENDRYQAEC